MANGLLSGGNWALPLMMAGSRMMGAPSVKEGLSQAVPVFGQGLMQQQQIAQQQEALKQNQARQALMDKMAQERHQFDMQAPERAKSLAAYKAILGGSQQPANVQEYNYFSKLSPEKKEEYLNMKRTRQAFNLGNEQVILSPMGGISESYQVTPKPEQMPEFQALQTLAKKRAETKAIGEANLPKIKGSFEATMAKNDRVNNIIDNVIPKIDNWTAGFGGSTLSKIAGTEASDLQANLTSIEANMGFDELQQMRANSPTGGALGQVSERELALLTSTVANIKQSQSPEQLKYNLAKLKTELAASKKRIEEAYQVDLQRFGKEAMQGVNMSGNKPQQSNDLSGMSTEELLGAL